MMKSLIGVFVLVGLLGFLAYIVFSDPGPDNNPENTAFLVVLMGGIAVLVLPLYFMIRIYRSPAETTISLPLVISLSVCFLGLILVLVGLQDAEAMIGLIMIMLGAISMVWGALLSLIPLCVFLFRKPTMAELATQRATNQRTWHIKPLGVVVIIGIFTTSGFVLEWLRRQIAPLNLHVSPKLFLVVYTLCVMALCATPPIRRRLYYVDEVADRQSPRP